MPTLKIETDQSKSYFKPSDAVVDQGFSQRDDVFSKDNKSYKIKSYDHYNTTIYSVTLREIKKHVN